MTDVKINQTMKVINRVRYPTSKPSAAHAPMAKSKAWTGRSPPIRWNEIRHCTGWVCKSTDRGRTPWSV